jgi:hypothetical protein
MTWHTHLKITQPKKNYPNPNKKNPPKLKLTHPTQIKSNHNKQIRDFYQKTTLVDFTMEVTLMASPTKNLD